MNDSPNLILQEIPAGLGFTQSDYYPYVYYKLNIDMIGSGGML